MRKIGTFLIGSALIAGAMFLVPQQGIHDLNCVNASGLGTALKDTDSATITITSTDEADKKTVSYYATPKLVVTGRDIDGESVKAGDTLTAIARRNGTTILKILEMNKDIKDPNKIYVGQKIRVK